MTLQLGSHLVEDIVEVSIGFLLDPEDQVPVANIILVDPGAGKSVASLLVSLGVDIAEEYTSKTRD